LLVAALSLPARSSSALKLAIAAMGLNLVFMR
jgi:hypothetical protein